MGTRITRRMIFPSPFSFGFTGGVKSRSVQSRGAAQWGQPCQSYSMAPPQLWQEAFSLAPHWGQAVKDS